MERLPLELVHAVCCHLSTPDVGSFRLVSKSFATVGQQYMLREIHTMFHPDSLERLESISKHPVYSHSVTSLFHEADMLPYFATMEEWERRIVRRHYEFLKRPSGATVSDREKRAYMRALKKIMRQPRHQYSSDELAEGWKNYHRLFEMQRMMDDDETLFREAMSRLPRLTSIKFRMGNYESIPTSTIMRLFNSALMRPASYEWHADCTGYRFLTKLLLGADFAKTRLEDLDASVIGWRFIAADDSVFARMKNTIRHLKTLSFWLSTGHDEQEAAECLDYLKSGRLREFVTTAPELNRLEVLFDHSYPVGTYPAELTQLVGEHIWSNLETVGFSSILASEEQLLEFFERHTGTLKRVSLDTITLSDGDWISTLQRMRQIVSLEHFNISGTLCSTGPIQHWSLNRKDFWGYKEIFLRKALTRYFIEEGLECPLLDPEFSDCFRG